MKKDDPEPGLERITPPNVLKLKAATSGIDRSRERKAQAENAVKTLALEHDDWLDTTLRRLETARADFSNDASAPHIRERFIRASLDVKGLGSTIGYPLLSRVAASLVRMLDFPGAVKEPPAELIDRHIVVLRSIVGGRWRSTAPPVFLEVIGDLERDVADLRARG